MIFTTIVEVPVISYVLLYKVQVTLGTFYTEKLPWSSNRGNKTVTNQNIQYQSLSL